MTRKEKKPSHSNIAKFHNKTISQILWLVYDVKTGKKREGRGLDTFKKLKEEFLVHVRSLNTRKSKNKRIQ